MNEKKENAMRDFVEMIEKAGTFSRLNEAERVRLLDALKTAENCGAIAGAYKTRWEILHAIYHAFLSGCGCNGPEWRRS